MPRLNNITLLVQSYDEAINFYVSKLGFELVEDTLLDGQKGKRWVVIRPPSSPTSATGILLARAVGPEQEAAVGNQAGGRVFLFLATDNFEREYEKFKGAGVKFLEEPRKEAYGRVVVWEDLYGNRWDLLEDVGGK